MHCEQCGTALKKQDMEKHVAMTHSKIRCECGEAVEPLKLSEHKATECVNRQAQVLEVLFVLKWPYSREGFACLLVSSAGKHSKRLPLCACTEKLHLIFCESMLCNVACSMYIFIDKNLCVSASGALSVFHSGSWTIMRDIVEPRLW